MVSQNIPTAVDRINGITLDLTFADTSRKIDGLLTEVQQIVDTLRSLR